MTLCVARKSDSDDDGHSAKRQKLAVAKPEGEGLGSAQTAQQAAASSSTSPAGNETAQNNFLLTRGHTTLVAVAQRNVPIESKTALLWSPSPLLPSRPAFADVDRLISDKVEDLQWDDRWLPQTFEPAKQYPGADQLFRDDVTLPVLFYGLEKSTSGRLRPDMVMADVGLDDYHQSLVEQLFQVSDVAVDPVG